jgi:DNA-binding NtrC family response regulator
LTLRRSCETVEKSGEEGAVTEVIREKWLILDDSASDRRRLVNVLSVFKDEAELIHASTVTEALEILSKKSISLCILDFFLRGTTTQRLITGIRSTHPEIPLVVVSGQAGSEKRIYNAGADAVVPKLMDLGAFASVVTNAVLHARELRKVKTERSQYRKVYLSPSITPQLRKILRSQSGHVLVTSPSGMGRSEIALSVAERLRYKNPQPDNQEVLKLSFSDEETLRNADELLFGKLQEKKIVTRGLLEKACDSVLLIDDAHLMQDSLRNKFKSIFKKGSFLGSSGILLETKRIRLIFTSSDDRQQISDIEELTQQQISFRINIPDFTKILDEKKSVIDFVFKRACLRERRELKPEKAFLRSLYAAVDRESHRVTLRSLMKTVDEAIERAGDDGRTAVVASDLGNFEFLFEDKERKVSGRTEVLELEYDDEIGIGPWLELYQAARNSSFDQANRILRQMMVDYAMIKFEGNKTKVAAQLDIARQHLYKPALRKMHLSN